MLAYFKKLVGDKQDKKIKEYYKKVELINALEAQYEQLSDQELREKTGYFRAQLANGKTIFDIQADAFSVVREAAKRVVGMRHFDVQLIGGMVLTEGNIAEMPTGEGKTLVASLPSYLRALEGKGVHVITVNEYLARRDRELIGQIHEFLGLTVGLNLPQMEPDHKKFAYQADITYGVGTEFGFDNLRDNMVYDIRQRAQRPYHFAIIDEVDSVLVDEAKTPLIIAGKTGISTELSYLCARIAKSFKEDVDFIFDIETKTTNFTDEGIARIERGFDIDNLYDLEHQTLYHYMIQALRARVMFSRDVDYIVKEGKILLIDMFTGRPMEGRTLSNGLHQAIEAKEGLAVSEENKTQASITIQNYYRLYPFLSGMTGTAKTEEKEFQQIYNMDVVQIPTNKPIIRVDLPDQVYDTIEHKYEAAIKRVKELHEKGQPILIGTTSILQSEKVAEFLRKEKLPFELLNAKTIEQEIQLISLAGQKGRITVATNMAGRGTDIMLGEGVAELGGLYVIGTEKHESRRIDNQLKGRSGRQGDPGCSEFFISIEDEMIRRFARDDVEKMSNSLKTDSNGLIINKNIHEFIDRVQRICEGANFSIREYHLKLDDVLSLQRNTVYDLRNKVLTSDDLLPLVKASIESYIKEEIERCCPADADKPEWKLTKLKERIVQIFPHDLLDFPNDPHDLDEVTEPIYAAMNAYLPMLDEYKENAEIGKAIKQFLLSVTDYHWLKHIDAMDRLKEGVGLRSYSQEDPMRQYAREALELFTQMYYELERDISRQMANLVGALETKG
ncbi:accessory Sec system translocase SecA2 [Bacillus sp. FJAT-29790]|uniref:accessory Sec system translocase SecA2 n=1 Tax=Bacillus sp. FJAT-29790 TaxID=1895002 RepID=UPI001C236273|nr:accessory Sec system translocase SecA2 [Bacillus sp. FJAT-29790]MBU8881106.1 accessory Sec system translocase SecA2 [Bacillus sp. FJAT-29790]